MTNSCKHTFRPDCESLEGLVLLSPLPSGPGGLGVIAPPGAVFIVEPCAELGASYAQIPKFGVQDPGGGNHVVREVAVLAAPPSSDSPLRPLGLTTDDTITRLDGVPLSCDQVDAHVGPATITYIRSSQGEFFEQTGTINLGAALQHNLDMINQYRAQAHAPALVLGPALNSFAEAASQDLMNTHIPHNYDHAHNNPYWETQGDGYGWPIVGWPDAPNLSATIDQILVSMMAEPLPPPSPGYNHHSIIIDPTHTQLGVGLIVDRDNGTLYFTNDFTP